jgi:hypothetical protein
MFTHSLGLTVLLPDGFPLHQKRSTKRNSPISGLFGKPFVIPIESVTTSIAAGGDFLEKTMVFY